MYMLQGITYSVLDIFLSFNLCFLWHLFTERTLFIHIGLLWKTLLLCLNVKSKCVCSGPCPLVDGYRREEMIKSSAQGLPFWEITTKLMDFLIYFFTSSGPRLYDYFETSVCYLLFLLAFCIKSISLASTPKLTVNWLALQ